MAGSKARVSEIATHQTEPSKVFAEKDRWGKQESILGFSLPQEPIPEPPIPH